MEGEAVSCKIEPKAEFKVEDEDVMEVPNIDIKAANKSTLIDLEEIDEDVPSDFFDDFMNTEFMEGLDVVDAWDEDETRNEEKKPVIKTEKRQISPPKNTDTLASSHRERIDFRRDPEKTKKAIAKDKEKCAKDKVAKIISEKLKIVETGLVPPGMETEVDLKEIKKQESIISKDKISEKKGNSQSKALCKEKIIKDLRDKLPPKKDFLASRDKRNTLLRTSRERKEMISKHSNREKRDFLIGNQRGVSRSSNEKRDTGPENRELLPESKEKYKSRSRSTEARLRYYYKRKLEDGRHSSEKRLHLRNRSRSIQRGRKSKSPRRHQFNEERYRRRDSPPLKRKFRGEPHFKFSPSPVMSEREMWLRHKNRKKNSSPMDTHHGERKRVDFLEELADKLNADELKKSDLYNKIQKQLNEPSKHTYMQGPAMPPMMDFIPAPVPPPPQQHFYPGPGPIQQQQFDEEFFIGQPSTFPDANPNFNQVFNFNQTIPPQYYHPPPINNTVPPPPQPVNFPKFTNPSHISPQIEDQQSVLTQLFENKKISLSGYLQTLSNKTGTDSTATIPIQKKVKVITLCQDVINSIGEFDGRFFFKSQKKGKQIEKTDNKYKTPVQKPPIVRFNFTSKCKPGGERSSLYNTYQKLLASVGLLKVPDAAPSPSLPSVVVPSVKDPVPQTITQKPPQQEPAKCKTCEMRNARKFVDSGSQCKSEMIDAGTQMTEEDLNRFGSKPMPKGILKNQSLAELTPAQLLSQSQSSFGGNNPGRMNQSLHMSEQGFVKSPEKKCDFNFIRPLFPSTSIFDNGMNSMNRKPNSLMQIDFSNQYFDFEAPSNIFDDLASQRQMNNKRGKKNRRGKFQGGSSGNPFFNNMQIL